MDKELHPLGIIPKKIWIAQRKQELIQAICRFLYAKKEVPYEWLEELKEMEDQE